jgi:hypothetical protein
MKIVLITGSRAWVREETVHQALDAVIRVWGTDVIIVHGTARGADTLAGDYAKLKGLTVEEHPADWDKHGKRAGYVRNAEMIALDADVVIAFIIDDSPGASMTAKLAADRGIKTIIYREFTGA